MKKTLLLSLTGIMAFSSAFALPSPIDRQAQCEKHQNDFVWVAKTKTCIPINPCTSDDEGIKKAYCLDVTFDTYLDGMQRPNMEPLKTLITRYAEKVLGTSVEGDMPMMNGYVGAKTTDGGYFVVKYKTPNTMSEFVDVYNSALAYGYKNVMVNMGTDGKVNGYTILDINKADCEDVADFATLVADTIVNFDYDKSNSKCVLMPMQKQWPDQSQYKDIKDNKEKKELVVTKIPR